MFPPAPGSLPSCETYIGKPEPGLYTPSARTQRNEIRSGQVLQRPKPARFDAHGGISSKISRHILYTALPELEQAGQGQYTVYSLQVGSSKIE